MTDNAAEELNQSGRCDCGAVVLTATGRPLSMFHCACENCQRASGAGHSSVVLFHADAIRIVGATKTYARPAASGATFLRHFCPECGCTILAQSSRAPSLRIVPIGVFSGQNDWFKPGQLIFAGTLPHWDRIDEHLPRHAAYKAGTAP